MANAGPARGVVYPPEDIKPFVNQGLQHWLKTREEWCQKTTDPLPSRDPPATYVERVLRSSAPKFDPPIALDAAIRGLQPLWEEEMD
eukprot:TRINITY_DN41966_c0_g1_i1.p1 TRINITY_DN41966_c0_g1~~TRINITY_DN41966_c0_g1_i1.p1  ORF type:complete len:101 (-),score=11.71 TRINITY_DN41966_c0_g1_i1:15-275(-)